MGKRALILFSIVTFILFSGCRCKSINDEKRISGIVDAVYTCYKNEKNMNKINIYLNRKVNNKEISQEVQYTITECLKKGEELK